MVQEYTDLGIRDRTLLPQICGSGIHKFGDTRSDVEIGGSGSSAGSPGQELAHPAPIGDSIRESSGKLWKALESSGKLWKALESSRGSVDSRFPPRFVI